MARFSVDLNWDVDEGVTIPLTVSGDYESAKANTRGHPDTWTEGWTELDVRRVENEHGCALPALVVGALCAQDEFLRAVENKIVENS